MATTNEMRNKDTPATNTHFSVVAMLAIRIQPGLKVVARLFMKRFIS